MDRYTRSMIKGIGRRKPQRYKYEIISISGSEFIQINSIFDYNYELDKQFIM